MSIPTLPSLDNFPDLIRALNERLRMIPGSTPLAPNEAQIGAASAGVSLTTIFQDVVGCELVLKQAGIYCLTGAIDFYGAGAGDAYVFGQGRLVCDGGPQTPTCMFYPLVLTGAGLTGSPVGLRSTVYQQWIYIAPKSGLIAKLQAKKTAGTGTSGTGTLSTLTALWIGP